MRRARLFGVVVLVGVLGLNLPLVGVLGLNLPLVGVAQSNPPISQSAVTQYVENLLTTYNTLIVENYSASPNSTITSHFALYQPVGYSFNVTVFWWNPSNTSQVGFTFKPILSDSPRIVVVNTSVGCNFLFGGTGFYESDCGHFSGRFGPGVMIQSGSLTTPWGAHLIPYTWIANSDNVFNNPLSGSGEAARFLFGYGQSTIPTPPAPNPYLNWLKAFWVWVVIGVGALISFVTGVHYLYKEWWLPRQKSKRLQAKRKAKADKENAKRHEEEMARAESIRSLSRESDGFAHALTSPTAIRGVSTSGP